MTASKASLLNTEMCLMRKVVLQNRMALGIITASQGGTWAIIPTKCCVFTPAESANITSLLNLRKTQVNTLSDPTPSLGDLINQWFRSWDSWQKKMICFGNHSLTLYFLLHVPILLL